MRVRSGGERKMEKLNKERVDMRTWRRSAHNFQEISSSKQ